MGGAAFLLFDYRNETCRDRVLKPWMQCAYTRRCMTLKGVMKKDHLPEQGVLSALLISNGIVELQKEHPVHTHILDG